MSWDRRRRLEAELKEKIATIVVERLSDPRIGFTTITRVELSRDRKIATVYYTAIGEATKRRTTQRGLQGASTHVQEILSHTLRSRDLPELRFVYDESVEKESTMRNLLEGIAEERASRDRPDEDPAADADADADADETRPGAG